MVSLAPVKKPTEDVLEARVERRTRPLVIRVVLQKHVYFMLCRIPHHVVLHVLLQLAIVAIKAISFACDDRFNLYSRNVRRGEREQSALIVTVSWKINEPHRERRNGNTPVIMGTLATRPSKAES